MTLSSKTKSSLIVFLSLNCDNIRMQLCHKNVHVIWGLNDSAVFSSWGSSIYSIEVCHSLPSLQFLARHVIKESIEEGQEKQLQLLPLPKKEIMQLSLLK
ncbi:MAG: hypothetical protein MJE68_22090, partial [Proteobacteria bacterium]|nr:hypothetical protein [Pseudomonadota bacterium]